MIRNVQVDSKCQSIFPLIAIALQSRGRSFPRARVFYLLSPLESNVTQRPEGNRDVTSLDVLFDREPDVILPEATGPSGRSCEFLCVQSQRAR